MHLISGCLFVIIFGVFIVFFSIIINLIRLIFNVKKTTKNFKKKAEEAFNQQSTSKTGQTHQHTKRPNNDNGKIFDKNEGEYIDFEEIKD